MPTSTLKSMQDRKKALQLRLWTNEEYPDGATSALLKVLWRQDLT
ncbi:hypothetical protein [Mastigocladopsis repens]|nr:hypothetical protein [Mastigocladopsis repens]